MLRTRRQRGVSEQRRQGRGTQLDRVRLSGCANSVNEEDEAFERLDDLLGD